MIFFSNAKISPQGKINVQDLKNVGHNALVFLAPLGVVYLLQLSGALQNGTLSWSSLIPTAATTGAIQLYCVNTLLDFFRKLQDGKK